MSSAEFPSKDFDMSTRHADGRRRIARARRLFRLPRLAEVPTRHLAAGWRVG